MNKKIFWNWASNENVLYIDGVIAEESWFDDDVTPKLFASELKSKSGGITVWLNSLGGDCIAASGIYTMLLEHEGKVTKLKNVNGAYIWQLSLKEGEPDRLLGYSADTSTCAPKAESFYAEGIYDTISNNMGYDGDLEIALIPESFRTEVLMEKADKNNVLIESSNAETVNFALLFEYDGDQKKIRHIMYNCSAARPTLEGETNEESREVQPEKLTIQARPLANGNVKARTGNETTKETYDNWYKAVYLPTEISVTPSRANTGGK